MNNLPVDDPRDGAGKEWYAADQVFVEIDVDDARPLDDIDQDFGANANNRWDD